MPKSATPRAETRFLLLVLAGGLALRLIWLAQVHGGISGFLGSGEATRVALAVARHAGIADAYYPGYGPTAHLLPVSPAIAGFLLWLFGPGSIAANLALLGWCLLQVGCAYLLLRRLFQKLGADPLVTRWGTALLCLAIPFAPQETIDFRYWEGALALCLAALNLLLILRYDARAKFGWRETLIVAALSAITFFVCPPVGLAVDACWAAFALRRLPLGRSVQLAAAAAFALALLVAPWAIRNAQVLGNPILLRSNFGLELALANHPAALSTQPPENVFAARLHAIHPYQVDKTRPQRIAPGGEVAYSQRLGAEAWRWIAANPAGFAHLSLRHLREFFFPRAWQMYFTGWEGMRAPRAVAISVVNLLGLIGLALGLGARRRGYWLLALYIGVVALPYGLLQPMSRYIYLVYGMLAFLAVEALLAGLRYAAARTGCAR